MSFVETHVQKNGNSDTKYYFIMQEYEYLFLNFFNSNLVDVKSITFPFGRIKKLEPERDFFLIVLYVVSQEMFNYFF